MDVISNPVFIRELDRQIALLNTNRGNPAGVTPMDWEQEAANEGPENADKLPGGYHYVTVTKAMRSKKDGTEFRTDKGPFLMLVLANEAGEEAADNLFLTDKAKWKLAKVCSRLGFDLAKMTEHKVTYEHFINPGFARKQFVGRKGWVEVTENGKYPKIEWLHAEELPPAILQVAKQQSHGAEPPTDYASTNGSPLDDADDLPDFLR